MYLSTGLQNSSSDLYKPQDDSNIQTDKPQYDDNKTNLSQTDSIGIISQLWELRQGIVQPKWTVTSDSITEVPKELIIGIEGFSPSNILLVELSLYSDKRQLF